MDDQETENSGRNQPGLITSNPISMTRYLTAKSLYLLLVSLLGQITWEKQFKKGEVWNWRHGSMVKSTECVCKGPGFGTQHPHCGLQLPVTLVLGNLMLRLASTDSCMYVANIQSDTHKVNTIFKKKKGFIFFSSLQFIITKKS